MSGLSKKGEEQLFQLLDCMQRGAGPWFRAAYAHINNSTDVMIALAMLRAAERKQDEVVFTLGIALTLAGGAAMTAARGAA